MKTKIKLLCTTLLVIFLMGCEDFLTVVPEDQLTLDGYFKTEAQCLQATAPLYGFSWFNFNDKASYAIGDIYSGNMFTTSDELINFHNYTVAQNNIRMFEAWSACYATIAHSNNIINNLPRIAGDYGVDPVVINQCVAEARFMRGTAYYFLVQLFGSVPIIEDGADAAANPIVPRIIEEDIYTFLLKDLEYAEQFSPVERTGSNAGRVTSGAAKAIMAKVYLSLKNFDAAKTKIEQVIGSDQYQLLDNYRDLFLTSESNYNAESIFAWGWVANQGWATQNTHQAFFAITGDITMVGDGWGTVKPSVDLINAFENGDLRKHEILMEDGDYYDELLSATGGFTFDLEEYGSETNSGIKKYVVGSPDDDNVGFMSTGINTDIIRYADVLLMYVESVMGNDDNTSDSKALGYYNDIRRRAGLATKTSVTRDDLLQERRVEFAFESQFLYDLVRLLGEQGAKDYLSNVERGRYSGDELLSQKFTCNAVKFSIPTSEIDQNPLLKEDPVPYY
ncbi:RagB/SusD family nutrient uptake outer membrane protein [Labilibacter marinus]|uniref:RagB/SusD family nutrient uptake outer membrane protein n=1 Tax=Labilibacter marinus TaxID=1477105 RepID=UPI00082F8A6F|nr:RagB/SusD family nutrient uptake outer membrane protein [Labilibacter marinus]